MSEREELHRLIETLPEGTMAQVRLGLEFLQNWPERPTPQQVKEKISQFMAERRKEGLTQLNAGGKMFAAMAGFGLGQSFNFASMIPGMAGASLSGGTAFGYIDGDTYVLERKLYHHGQEVKTIERCRIEREQRLIYSIDVTGPAGQTGRHEFTFELKK